MKRFKSVDFFRGLSIGYMLFGHFTEWFLIEQDMIFFYTMRVIFEFLGSGAFLLISGMSTIFSYRKRMNQYRDGNDFDKKFLRKEYYFRALLLLVAGIAYNIFVIFSFGGIEDIWTWFILITISFSLIVSWPLLNTSKIFRILIGVSVWILNYLLLSVLLPFEGQGNALGITFHILYNNLELDPLLQFFPFFIIGTVVGDILVEIYKTDDKKQQKDLLKRNFLFPCLMIGFFLVGLGAIVNFPEFLTHRTSPWIIYSLGLDLILLSVLVTLEESKYFSKEKSYRFFYYFSYYSFTIYLAHNVLYFVFHRMIPAIFIIPLNFTIILIIWALLRMIHKKVGPDAALKYQISKIATHLAEKLQEKQLMKVEKIQKIQNEK